ncbi:beta-carotene 15, 15-dioxygenase 2, like isoform X3 [Oryzias latipes]
MPATTEQYTHNLSSRERCPKADDLESLEHLVQSGEETPEPIPTTIKGSIPTWINGSFLRNGPGKFEFGEDKYIHWFDGMAMMHRFHIRDGSVTYSSRFLRSDSYVQNLEKNRIVVSEFGTVASPDPCQSIFARFFSYFQTPQPTDNANVNFVKYKGDYYVSTETNYMRRVDPQSLETKEKVDWSQYIAVNSATAHPHYDREGATYNMGNSYGRNGFFYNIIRVPPPEDKSAVEDSADLRGAEVICSIPADEPRKPSYYHSFVMSENYIVFIEQPIKLNLLKFMLYKIQGKSFHNILSWEPQYGTVFHLVHRRTGKKSPVKYRAAPMFTLHQINAYEDNGFLVMDMCCGDDGVVIGEFTLENLRRESGQAMDEFYNSLCRNLPRRYVLPLNVDENTPLDENLITLHDCKATAMKTNPEEVKAEKCSRVSAACLPARVAENTYWWETLIRCGVILACTRLSLSLLLRLELQRKMMEWFCQSLSLLERRKALFYSFWMPGPSLSWAELRSLSTSHVAPMEYLTRWADQHPAILSTGCHYL